MGDSVKIIKEPEITVKEYARGANVQPQDLDDVSNVGPVLKFDINYNTPVDIGDTGTNTLEDLFPSSSGLSGNFDQVVELSKGLANGKLFYNFEKKSIMVNGQIFHGDSGNRITDTYNFTVSPRG